MEQKELYAQIGQNLKTRRQELKKRQSEIAEAAGISRPSLANIEGGRQAITLHLVYKLAAVLDLKDAKILLPSANIGIEKSANQPIVNVLTMGSNLNKDQVAQIQRTVAASTSER